MNRSAKKTLLIALLALAVISLTSAPAVAASPVKTPAAKKAAPAPEHKMKVNRTVPNVAAPTLMPVFSDIPTDQEISRARVFEEPLIPYGPATTPEENQSLVNSIKTYQYSGGGEKVEPLLYFLNDYPQSAWRASLLTNLGIVYRHTGYFSRALNAWDEAWRLSRDAKTGKPKAMADRALGELAELNARLGRYDMLEKLFADTSGRNVRGSASQKVFAARQGLLLMNNQPEKAFLCGPYALDRILAFQHGQDPFHEKLSEAHSSRNGFSLNQVNRLAGEVGLKMQMARRGSKGEPVFPAVVNWKAGHYAALLKEDSGRYLVQDPTFGHEIWISRKALDEESSGYFLIPEGPLPEGWTSVSEAEGTTIWGKGSTTAGGDEHFTCNDQTEGGDGGCGSGCDACNHGMPTYRFHSMLVSLNINDTPVGYSPPFGPAVNFRVTYNQRESFQPSSFTYSNLGYNWTHNWLSYVTDDPTTAGGTVTLYVSGGGQETFTGYDSGTKQFSAHLVSQAILYRDVVGGTIQYERRFSDGSKDVYHQPDGASTSPRKVFLTKRIDSKGNEVTLAYDSNHKLTSITDAIGQVTTFTYGNTDANLITAVTDPFGRSASFDYNEDGQLVQITDVISMASQFAYGDGDFIESMTTPYGTTTFTRGEELSGGTEQRVLWLEAVDPLGGRERLEFSEAQDAIPDRVDSYTPAVLLSSVIPALPSGAFLNNYNTLRNSFYWDKRAMASGVKDYGKAKITHWLKESNLNYVSGLKESEKLPLENRVFYAYKLSSGITSNYTGDESKPKYVGRKLNSTDTQLYQYDYNPLGKIKKVIDPLDRETGFVYDTNNIDLLKVKRRNGGSSPDCTASATTANCELLATLTYKSGGQHLVETYTDASGQVTAYTYNDQGQVLAVTNPLSEVTTYTYENPVDAYNYGYLVNITGPDSGATLDITYDYYGRIQTTTDSDGRVMTYDYDNLDRVTKITYPDSTKETIGYTRLDAETFHDRQGRASSVFHDALRRVVSSHDPLGRTTTQQWLDGNLLNLIDPNGNTTHWDYDLQGRVTKETRADDSEANYEYEATTSRLHQVTDAKSQTKTYTYNKDNRLHDIAYSGSVTPAVTFTYDSAYNRVTNMTYGSSSTDYAYNAIPTSIPSPTTGNGRLHTIDGPLGSDTLTYAYDELGRVNNRRVNGTANEETRNFDNLGRVNYKTNLLGSSGYNYYTPTSRLDELDFPNGVITTYTYQNNEELVNPNLRLTKINTMSPSICEGYSCSEPMLISQHDYLYTKSGNISSWKQTNAEFVEKLYAFTYDFADQLTDARSTISEAPVSYYAYNYDGSGNRISEQISDYSGPSTSLTGATYTSMNRLDSQQPGGPMRFAGTINEPASVVISVDVDHHSQAQPKWTGLFAGTAWLTAGSNDGIEVKATDLGADSGNVTTNTFDVEVSGTTNGDYAYDDNGNMTADGTRTYTWDAENRLLKIDYDGTSLHSEFVYDGYGRRVEIIEKDGTTVTSDHKFIWCGVSICEERDSDGTTVLRRYYAEGVEDNGDPYFYHRDHLGSVREVTDSTGTVVARYDYDPYGRRTKIDGDYDALNGYTGHFTHERSSLILTLFRAYDPNIGRWLNEDPIGLDGGLNLYSYVDNNSIVYIDPFGLDRDIYVLIWNQKGRSVGHIAAFELNGKPILSQFPFKNGKVCGCAKGDNTRLSLAGTMGEEKRKPNYVYKVTITNEPAFDKEVENQVGRSTWFWMPYNSLGEDSNKNQTNCAHSVTAALRAGGIDILNESAWPGNINFDLYSHLGHGVSKANYNDIPGAPPWP